MSDEWDGKVVMSTPGGPIVEMSLGDLLARKDAEIERLRAERDALRDAAREYLTTLGGAMKSGKFQMGGTAEMAHFVRQAMQMLDSLVFDREGPRPAGLEKLHEPLKRPS